MPRYIDADTLYQKIDAWREKIAMETPWDEEVACLGDVLDIIDDAPTEDVVERKKGHWIEYIPEHGKCPFCGNQVDLLGGKENNFCGECGADMREEKTNED